MGSYNIFEWAVSNRTYLSREYNKILNKLNGDKTKINKIKNIENKVKNDLKISMNTGMMGILGFLKDEIYKNKHDLVEEGIKKLKSKKEKDDYEKRKYFDFMFEEGRKFKYGALYIDGCGVKEYGSFCIVISGKELKNLCFLKYDSLKNYVVEENGKYCLKENELKRDLSDKDNAHCLLVIKHHGDIINKSEKEIAFVVCGDDYIEAITTDDITPKKVIKVVFLIDKKLQEILKSHGLEYECDMLTLLKNMLKYYRKEEMFNESKKHISAKVENMSKLYDAIENLVNNKEDLIFEVYVEYNNEKNPKKVW